MKIIYSVLGLLSLALGILGIFLPLLPTTPFLLLSAALFAKSSTKLYNWLMNHRIFGKLIKIYKEGRPIPLKIKLTAVTLLWTTILISVFTVVNDMWWAQILLISFASGATYHIFTIKPKKQI